MNDKVDDFIYKLHAKLWEAVWQKIPREGMLWGKMNEMDLRQTVDSIRVLLESDMRK